MSKEFSPVNGQTFHETVKKAAEAKLQAIPTPRNASVKTGYKIGDHYFKIPEDLQAEKGELDLKAIVSLTIQKKEGSETSWFMNSSEHQTDDLLNAM